MAAMKIYEAKTLSSATEERAKQYENLKAQLNKLKQQFQAIVDNNDFQGAGAVAIKGFYQAQIDVLNIWVQLTEANIKFFKGLPGDLEGADLTGDTIVHSNILEHNLEQSIRNNKTMVSQQQEDLQSIFDEIRDLISLHVFSEETFLDQIEKADKERKDALQKLNELDQQLSNEYTGLNSIETRIQGMYSALLNASNKGQEVSPLFFDSKAYKNSEMYKVNEEASKQAADYIKAKDEQAEARKVEKAMIEKENRPWYQKGWDMASDFVGEASGYYDTVRATTGVDPVTGRKLSAAERIAAGAMAAAGFIPVVGWAGRLAKGGKAIYATVKGVTTASKALDAYKTAKGMQILGKAEKGIYGLISGNGLAEGITGKDMFGNQLTEEQRKNSLLTGFSILGLGGAAAAFDKYGHKIPHMKFPFSSEHAAKMKDMGNDILNKIKTHIGNLNTPIFVKHELATPMGSVNHWTVESRKLNEVAPRMFSVNTGTTGTGKNITQGARYGERKISDETYTKLRRASPSSKIQREVNKNIDDIIGTEDFALPGKIIDKKLHADHIVSLEKIARLEGFETLTYKQQKEIANFVENFIGLSEAANTSKGSKSFADWYIYKKENIPVNPVFREKMILKEKELEIEIQKMIDEFNRINKKE